MNILSGKKGKYCTYIFENYLNKFKG